MNIMTYEQALKATSIIMWASRQAETECPVSITEEEARDICRRILYKTETKNEYLKMLKEEAKEICKNDGKGIA